MRSFAVAVFVVLAAAVLLTSSAAADPKVFQATPSDTPETVSFVLQMRNLAQLEQQVLAGMPGGYLSVADFAALYGQSSANIAALRSYLATFGIETTAMEDGIDVQASGTAGQFDAALSVQQANSLTDQGAVVHAPQQQPLLPPNLQQFVLGELGLSNYPVAKSDTLTSAGLHSTSTTGTPSDGNLTPTYFAQHYDLAPLYKRGATGAGRTVGIVALGSFDPGDAETFWSALGISSDPNRISVIPVDGGSSSAAIETTLDVEQSGGVAPQAHVRVYEAPNSDEGFVDAFFRAASDNAADSVSASWGQSESIIAALANGGHYYSAAYAQSFDEALLELAAQGQSSFTSSGDYGPYDSYSCCGVTDIATGWPSSSPWITSAGGTTLPGVQSFVSGSETATVTIPAERTFGWDYYWPLAPLFGATEAQWTLQYPYGSGGGFSAFEAEPSYQAGLTGTEQFDAVPYLTPTAYKPYATTKLPTQWLFNPTPAVTTGAGTGRETPDVSADADPNTGYAVYDSVYGWLSYVGGTSFVAPQLNGATAVVDSLLGGRVGLWNPAIYRFATQRRSPFTPLDTTGTGNDNLYYTGTPGNVFNPGSGLGIPDLVQLASDFSLDG